MTLEQIFVALIAGLGGSATLVALLRVGLPWVRKAIPSLFAIRASLDASQARLVASLQTEVTELTRQHSVLRGERDEAAKREAECRAALDYLRSGRP